MKKVFICLLAAIIFSNCEIKVREAKADIGYYQKERVTFDFSIQLNRITIDSMEYIIITNHGAYGSQPTIFNATKDSLEVALLRKQLANYK